MQNSLTNVQGELEAARERLKGVEENIKKSIGRDILGPNPLRVGFKRARQPDQDGPEGANNNVPNRIVQIKGRRTVIATNDLATRLRRDNTKQEERIPAKKRLGEQTVTVFSRLSGPPKDDEFEMKDGIKSKVTSQVIVQDMPSRKDVLAAQSGDKQCKARNRRMFGALLGTLQKFRQEENRLKEKEEKRAQVEKKLEEAALREKEEMKKKRQELFSTRRQQQLEIRQLEYKLMRLKQFAEWESSKKHLLNFIQTSASPKIFYLPKKHTEKSQKLLEASQQKINRMIEAKRAEVQKAIAMYGTEKRAGVVIKVEKDKNKNNSSHSKEPEELEENNHTDEDDETKEIKADEMTMDTTGEFEVIADDEITDQTVEDVHQEMDQEEADVTIEEESMEDSRMEESRTDFVETNEEQTNVNLNGSVSDDKENCVETNKEGTPQDV